MTPRPYQLEAGESLDAYLASHDDNPCIVLPTGSGKTPTYAWAIQRYLQQWPGTRICVLAHVKELIQQGVDKMREIWPMAPLGIYSAGLRAKEMHYPITFASIQSIYAKACEFDPFDLIFIDEAHRIPLSQDGQYRQFIRDAKLNNPRLRIVGWTATPYRLAGGNICHKDYVLNKVIYAANVKHLIDDGYLCPLRTKLGRREVDTAGVTKSKGEFDTKQLEKCAMVDGTVDAIAAEAVGILNRENRKAALFFCVTVDHAEKVARAIGQLGLHAPTIHAKTPDGQRDAITRDFVAGKLRAICNVNVLSEGFDARHIDAIALIRPTASKGLYYQQVGRGLRIHPDKKDCLILDFAGNVSRHGPIDLLEGYKPEMLTCETCRDHFPAPVGKCPGCGWTPPPPEPKELPAGPSPGRIIPTDPKARTEGPILSDAKPWDMLVTEVQVKLHEKPGKPRSLLVTYINGLQSHREWICLGHGATYPGHKARQWWKARFGEPVPASADEALAGDLFLGQRIASVTESIAVRQAGKYTEIVGAKLRSQLSPFAH